LPNFQKKRKILKVEKQSALRKARSVPLFDAQRNSLSRNRPAAPKVAAATFDGNFSTLNLFRDVAKYLNPNRHSPNLIGG